jgi:hypothetical protein
MTLSVVTIEPGDLDAEQYRNDSAWQPRTGFLPGFVPSVSVDGMTSSYTAFRGRIQGTDLQAAYGAYSIDGETVTHTAGGAQPRIDAVVVRVRNTAYDQTGFDDAAVTVIEGAENTVPVPPDLGPTDLLLGDITIPANASAAAPLVAANISTARRPGLVVAAGGILPVTQNDPDDGPYVGAWRDNAGVLERWTGDGTWQSRPAAGNPAARLYYAGSGQVVHDSTVTGLTGLTVDYANGGMIATSGGITVPVTGVYLVTALTSLNGTSNSKPPSGKTYGCMVYRNNVQLRQWFESTSDTRAFPTVHGSEPFSLTAGDALDLRAFHNAGSDLFSKGSADSGAYACSLAAVLVSQ